MALRLVAPVDGPATQTTAAPATGAAAVAQVTNRAAGLLDAHDLDGWRALVAAAAQLADEHDRYLARRLLLESVLRNRASTGAQNAERLLAGAIAAVEALEDTPREPVLLNFAGVLLYELGAIVAAEALFRAAQRLDPDLADVAANLRECKRRRQQGITTPQGLPPQVLRALRDLGPRAQRAAQKGSAGERSDGEPLHDRQGRGGDAPALLGRRGGVRRRADRRRHRLDGPDDRDRRVLRRTGLASRVGRRLLRGPQRRP